MSARRILSGILMAAALSGVSIAQTGERGGIPPGTSQDGSRPSEGAIKGGSIVPGKSGDVPKAGSNRPAESEINRCRELVGVLREQCLRDLGASGSDARAADGAPSMPGRDPVTSPQKPR
jgi:hypothetical protein